MEAFIQRVFWLIHLFLPVKETPVSTGRLLHNCVKPDWQQSHVTSQQAGYPQAGCQFHGHTFNLAVFTWNSLTQLGLGFKNKIGREYHEALKAIRI